MIHPLRAAALVVAFAAAASAQNTQGLPTIKEKDPKRDARIQYHLAQSVLYSAIAHAEALKALSEEPGGVATDVALSHAKEIGRDINECRTSLEKVGQAEPSVEKKEATKTLRSELDQAFKDADAAHRAIDGHGKLPGPAAGAVTHLRASLAALFSLAGDVGVKPITMGDAKKPD